jgi:aminopeptidase N
MAWYLAKTNLGQRTIFADNWPNRARNWLPCVDHLSDKAGVDFMVTAPDHYRVISNGLLEEESMMDGHRKFTHWKETVALPTKVMVIGAADFSVHNEGSVDCIPVSSWVFPQDKIKGFYDYGQAMEILPFFIKTVGTYAYKKAGKCGSSNYIRRNGKCRVPFFTMIKALLVNVVILKN